MRHVILFDIFCLVLRITIFIFRMMQYPKKCDHEDRIRHKKDITIRIRCSTYDIRNSIVGAKEA